MFSRGIVPVIKSMFPPNQETLKVEAIKSFLLSIENFIPELIKSSKVKNGLKQSQEKVLCKIICTGLKTHFRYLYQVKGLYEWLGEPQRALSLNVYQTFDQFLYRYMINIEGRDILYLLQQKFYKSITEKMEKEGKIVRH